MQYQALLKQAALLPCVVTTKQLPGSASRGTGGGSEAYITIGGVTVEVPRCDDAGGFMTMRKQFATAKLLTHSVNVLPKAYEALKAAQRSICRLSGCSKMLNAHTKDCLVVKEAIAAIENVKE